MLTPAYNLTIGDRVVDSTEEPRASALTDLTVSLNMDVPADSFTLVLGRVGGLSPERDDDASIELGYADGDLQKVITGKVASTEPGLTSMRVIGYSPAAVLLRSSGELNFEGKTAGAIVQDLAGKAGVGVARADDGITFPYYVIDGRRSFYSHIKDLARLSGLDLYINPDGEIVLKRFTGGRTVHVLEYGKHIIETEVREAAPPAGLVEAWGESPGGGRAEEAWAWLTKDFSSSLGKAGSDGAKLHIESSSLRTAGAARTAAEAALTEIQRRSVRGRITIAGRPEVLLGDSIRLSGIPDGPEGTFQVRSITHQITKARGFTTTVGFRSI
jgi:phage protein D